MAALGFDAVETYNWKDLDADEIRAVCAETGVEFMTSSSGGTVEGEDGKVYYEQSLYVRGMGTHSDTIRVTPDKQGTFEPDDEGSFVIELIP